MSVLNNKRSIKESAQKNKLDDSSKCRMSHNNDIPTVNIVQTKNKIQHITKYISEH